MDIVEVFVISMSIFIVVYLFLMQPHQVKGSSMFPTYHDGEYLMTDKVSYRTRTPKRGEVVVFKAPVNEDFDFIKRVIGIPGDTVMVKGGKVYVNGQMIDETYLPPEYETRSGRSIREGVPVTVGPEEYIVFGDNRGHSSDSREWGTVPIDNFIGRAFFLYWPPNRVGVIGQDGYAPFAKLEN
jgi:signal peptidase I